MSRSHVVVSKADARKLSAPLLEIASGAVVTPIQAWRQASVMRPGAAELHMGARYTVARVEGGFSGAFVTVVEQPGEMFPAHLFARAA
jgi:hypothetical protein